MISVPRRSRRSAVGGRVLRLARLGGIFALGLAAAGARAANVNTNRGHASAASAKAPAGPPGVAGLFADPELAHRDADYAHFAELLGTIMLMREGGVEGALDAVPVLHDESLAYLSAASLIADSNAALSNSLQATAGAAGAFNLSSWPGLSNAAALKMAKNYTDLFGDGDPLHAQGEALGAQINATFGPEPDKDFTKANATLNALGSFVTAGKADDKAFIDDLNARLSKYNIQFKGKDISPPARFSNGANIIARAITGIGLSANAINFAPCLISYSVTGVNLDPTAINFAPVGIAATPVGATVSAQGVAINPSVILIQPQGVNVQPQGVQVAPYLIAVAPVGAGAQPAGVNVAPNGIVVGPVGRAYTPQGAVVAPVNNAYAPVRIDLTPPKPGDDTGDASGFNDNNGSKKRKSRKLMGSPPQQPGAAAAASEGNEEEPVREMHVDPFGGQLGGKLVISEDPLDLSNELPKDYRNWASVLSQVLLKKEGSLETAAKVLQRVMLATHGHLSKVANGEEFFPRFHLQDPVLTADAGAAINGVLGPDGPIAALPQVDGKLFSAGATFFNYAPCVLSENYQGINVALTGLNFAPTLFSLGVTGFNADITPLTITPNLIYIQPIGAQVNPQGVNIQPGLLYVGPIGANAQPQGVNIQPQLITVAPTGAISQPTGVLVAPADIAIAPVDTLYGPQGVAYAPVKNDLTAAPDQFTFPGDRR